MIDHLISSASALLLIDVLRVVAAAMCLAVTAAALYLAMQPGQRRAYRDLLLCIVLFAVAAIGTQLERLNMPLSYRLVAELLAVALAVRGLWTVQQQRSQSRHGRHE